MQGQTNRSHQNKLKKTGTRN